MVLDQSTRQGLGEQVGRHFFGVEMSHGDGFDLGDFVANPVESDGDMLHGRLVDSIVKDLDGPEVVAVERRGRGEGVTDLL